MKLKKLLAAAATITPMLTSTVLADTNAAIEHLPKFYDTTAICDALTMPEKCATFAAEHKICMDAVLYSNAARLIEDYTTISKDYNQKLLEIGAINISSQSPEDIIAQSNSILISTTNAITSMTQYPDSQASFIEALAVNKRPCQEIAAKKAGLQFVTK